MAGVDGKALGEGVRVNPLTRLRLVVEARRLLQAGI